MQSFILSNLTDRKKMRECLANVNKSKIVFLAFTKLFRQLFLQLPF